MKLYKTVRVYDPEVKQKTLKLEYYDNKKSVHFTASNGYDVWFNKEGETWVCNELLSGMALCTAPTLKECRSKLDKIEAEIGRSRLITTINDQIRWLQSEGLELPNLTE